jgi:predicted HTH transcriptional regulator
MKSTLSPLDLLFMSDLEQQTIRYLNEYPNSTAVEIATIIQVAESELACILKQLVKQAKIVKHGRNGQSTYIVNYRDLKESRLRNLPNNIWSGFD